MTTPEGLNYFLPTFKDNTQVWASVKLHQRGVKESVSNKKILKSEFCFRTKKVYFHYL